MYSLAEITLFERAIIWQHRYLFPDHQKVGRVLGVRLHTKASKGQFERQVAALGYPPQTVADHACKIVVLDSFLDLGVSADSGGALVAEAHAIVGGAATAEEQTLALASILDLCAAASVIMGHAQALLDIEDDPAVRGLYGAVCGIECQARALMAAQAD